ncbi:hypothetical protein PENTCL1PPCAC_27167, partial [Pristionchus entomophagus]
RLMDEKSDVTVPSAEDVEDEQNDSGDASSLTSHEEARMPEAADESQAILIQRTDAMDASKPNEAVAEQTPAQMTPFAQPLNEQRPACPSVSIMAVTT